MTGNMTHDGSVDLFGENQEFWKIKLKFLLFLSINKESATTFSISL